MNPFLMQKNRNSLKRQLTFIFQLVMIRSSSTIFLSDAWGWSNETTWPGSPDQPSEFKNILDHAIADGKINPLIIVCPAYNNTSGEDSADYSLALKLTDQYHQELARDLIPAVESKYSTFAEDTTEEGIKKSRDHWCTP